MERDGPDQLDLFGGPKPTKTGGAIACRACVRCGGAAYKPRPFECPACGAWNALPRRKGTAPANPDPA